MKDLQFLLDSLHLCLDLHASTIDSHSRTIDLLARDNRNLGIRVSELSNRILKLEQMRLGVVK